MEQGAALVVLGAIHCVGTASQVIIFEQASGATYWSTVGMIEADGTAEVQHTRFRLGREGTYQGHYLRGTLSAINSDVRFTDCRFHDSRRHAISVEGCSGVLARNRFTEIINEPLDINDSSVDVIDNEIYSARLDAIDYNGSIGTPQISGNLIEGGEDDGIDLDGFNGTLAGNIISGCVDKGISASSSSNVVLENNVISDCYIAIAVTAGSVADVLNNTLTRCFYGLRGYEKVPGAGGATITGMNMLIWDHVVSVYLDALSTATLTHSDIQGNSVYPGEGNLNVDPLFVDRAGGDFHLREDSPCIDAGYGGATIPPFDFEGDPRADHPGVPNTGGGTMPWVDIGADEFQPQVASVVLGPSPPGPAFLTVRPNPIGSRGQLSLAGPEEGRGELGLVDVSGRLVRRWLDLYLPAVIMWDGRDATGRELAGGIYFLVFTPEGQAPASTARIALIHGVEHR
jgi:parallel beta-helix repeat protein